MFKLCSGEVLSIKSEDVSLFTPILCWGWYRDLFGSGSVLCILCSGSGNGSAGGAAAGLGWGDPGRGSCSSLGEALVPWGPDGWHHSALYVSPFYCVLRHELLSCGVHCWHSTHFLPLKCICNRKCLHWPSCVSLVPIQVSSLHWTCLQTLRLKC